MSLQHVKDTISTEDLFILCSEEPSITPDGYVEVMRKYFKYCLPEESSKEMTGLFEKTLSMLHEENRLRLGELVSIIVVYLTFIVFGTIGSASVIIVVIRQPRMRTPHNLFTVNLAVGDLVLCLFTQPFNLLRILYWHVDWTLGSVMCKAVETAQATNIFVSTLNISVIALDRLLVIVYPRRTKLKQTGVLVTIGFIWIIALLLACPMIAFTSVSRGTIRADASVCSASTIESDNLRQLKIIYGRVTLVVQYLVPLIIVGYAYTRIYLRIRTRHKFHANNSSGILSEVQSIAGKSAVTRNTDYLAPPQMDELDASNYALELTGSLNACAVDGSQTETHKFSRSGEKSLSRFRKHRSKTSKQYSARKQCIRKRQAKTNALLLAITLTFILSWTPLHVFTFVMDAVESNISDRVSMGQVFTTNTTRWPSFQNQTNNTTAVGLLSIDENNMNLVGRYVTIVNAMCLLCVHLAACVNPILYGWLNENFHKEYKNMFFQNCC